MIRGLAFATGLIGIVLGTAVASAADGPLLLDDKRGAPSETRGAWQALPPIPPSGRPHRLVGGGPGYVGSDWGLGKPSYSGIGSRPDHGVYWD